MSTPALPVRGSTGRSATRLGCSSADWSNLLLLLGCDIASSQSIGSGQGGGPAAGLEPSVGLARLTCTGSGHASVREEGAPERVGLGSGAVVTVWAGVVSATRLVCSVIWVVVSVLVLMVWSHRLKSSVGLSRLTRLGVIVLVRVKRVLLNVVGLVLVLAFVVILIFVLVVVFVLVLGLVLVLWCWCCSWCETTFKFLD